MDQADNINKVTEDESEQEQYEFKYSFVNTPWDDRSDRSKIGIVILLVGIFVAIMALIINDFVMHYRRYNESNERKPGDSHNCRLVKMDQYPFVARIYAMNAEDLLCVGAVVSTTTVLANEVCVKSGPIHIELGSSSDPRCQKRFEIYALNIIPHDGVASHNLVLLRAAENLNDCSEVIPIGKSLRTGSEATVIGRSSLDKKAISRRIVNVVGTGTCRSEVMRTQSLNQKSTICVKDYSQCPALASDLLVQDEHLYGLASTSSHREDQKMVLFANLEMVRRALKELEPEIIH